MQLKEKGYHINEDSIRSGFKNVIRLTGLQGRWQTIARKPKTICDVGHNEAGISHILEQLKDEKFNRLHWVFGLVNDKDADSILGMLPEHALYYFCKANIPRGLDVDILRAKANSFRLKGSTYPSVKDAYHAAVKAAGKNDLIFIGGSTFVVAEVL